MVTRTRLTTRGRVVLAAVTGFVLYAFVVLVIGGGGGPRTLVRGEPAPKPVVVDTLQGEATFYGPGLPADAVTASGEAFDPDALAAAHATLDFGTQVRVIRADGAQQVVVTVNDRLPDGGPGRIDVTPAAAERLAMLDEGRAPVTLEVLALQGR